MRKFEAQIAERIMGMTLDSKEIWEGQVNKLDKDEKPKKKVSYEDAKEFLNQKNTL